MAVHINLLIFFKTLITSLLVQILHKRASIYTDCQVLHRRYIIFAKPCFSLLNLYYSRFQDFQDLVSTVTPTGALVKTF